MAYATVAEIKGWLNIPVSDTVDDARLSLGLDAASDAVDDYCHRTFTTAGSATARVYRPYRTGTLWTDDVSETAALVVKTDDDDDGTFETTWAASDFLAEPANALATGRPVTHLVPTGTRSFPCSGPRSRVQVTAKWGWPTTPAKVKQATLVLASRLFKRKESPEGVLGNAEFGVVRVSRTDPDVAALLDPFALAVVA